MIKEALIRFCCKVWVHSLRWTYNGYFLFYLFKFSIFWTIFYLSGRQGYSLHGHLSAFRKCGFCTYRKYNSWYGAVNETVTYPSHNGFLGQFSGLSIGSTGLTAFHHIYISSLLCISGAQVAAGAVRVLRAVLLGLAHTAGLLPYMGKLLNWLRRLEFHSVTSLPTTLPEFGSRSFTFFGGIWTSVLFPRKRGKRNYRALFLRLKHIRDDRLC